MQGHLDTHAFFLREAILEATRGMRSGDGGPFGAVIVLDGEIIARAHNTVVLTHDPTAHAEVNAVRRAAAALNRHHLSGAILYTNFEPCPMCLSAAYWADIREIWYCADREQAARAGFRDSTLYKEIAKRESDREIHSRHLGLKEMEQLLEEWQGMDGKILY